MPTGVDRMPAVSAPNAALGKSNVRTSLSAVLNRTMNPPACPAGINPITLVIVIVRLVIVALAGGKPHSAARRRAGGRRSRNTRTTTLTLNCSRLTAAAVISYGGEAVCLIRANPGPRRFQTCCSVGATALKGQLCRRQTICRPPASPLPTPPLSAATRLPRQRRGRWTAGADPPRSFRCWPTSDAPAPNRPPGMCSWLRTPQTP
jgi:hypothetical protein